MYFITEWYLISKNTWLSNSRIWTTLVLSWHPQHTFTTQPPEAFSSHPSAFLISHPATPIDRSNTPLTMTQQITSNGSVTLQAHIILRGAELNNVKVLYLPHYCGNKCYNRGGLSINFHSMLEEWERDQTFVSCFGLAPTLIFTGFWMNKCRKSGPFVSPFWFVSGFVPRFQSFALITS